MKFQLLSDGRQNHKIGKNKDKSYRIFSLNLNPHKIDIDGKTYNVCPWAGSCAAACVGNNGHFAMKNGSAKKAQIRRTEMYFRAPRAFYSLLYTEIAAARQLAAKRGAIAVFRLNAYSDINHGKQSKRYTGVNVYDFFSDCIFYDYTKDYKKALTNNKSNYFVTFSYDENSTTDQIHILLAKGINVAVVFDQLPYGYLGYKVVNGDIDDNRFLDPTGVIVGLKFKGSKAKLLQAIEQNFALAI